VGIDDEEASGRLMAAEIAEQPDLWQAGLARRSEAMAIARAIAARRPRFVLLAARGTSDHAALYAKYLVEILHRLPAGLVSPSTMTAYEAEPDLRDVLLIAVSQSGGSPDLLRTIEVGRHGGATTLAVTNAPESPLARAAELHLDVGAGAERAVAATKSYTAQLLALYLVLDALRGGTGADAESLPDRGHAVLAAAGRVMPGQAARYRFAQRMVVTGRGYAYATAREAALKLMETSYVAAQAFSGADLLHGPLAMLDAQVPVLAIVPEGIAGAAMAAVLPRVRQTGAEVFVVGHQPDAGFKLPEGTAEALSPLLEILPFQLLALHLAIARGENPDAPRGLHKITRTL
jgi:glucosamine--fructose-6-phosphate aminotransferase (isomerizing)